MLKRSTLQIFLPLFSIVSHWQQFHFHNPPLEYICQCSLDIAACCVLLDSINAFGGNLRMKRSATVAVGDSRGRWQHNCTLTGLRTFTYSGRARQLSHSAQEKWRLNNRIPLFDYLGLWYNRTPTSAFLPWLLHAFVNETSENPSRYNELQIVCL